MPSIFFLIQVQVEFTNDERIHGFLITIKRSEDLVTDLDTNQTDFVTDLGTVRSNLVTDSSTVNTDLVTMRRSLSNKEKDIVNFCSVPRSSKEILDRIGVTSQTKNREKYITSLIDAGYLEMTNPDNPTAHNQKYRKK